MGKTIENLFLVSTSLHLINSIEASVQLNLKGCHVIVMTEPESTHEAQIKEALKLHAWDKVSWVYAQKGLSWFTQFFEVRKEAKGHSYQRIFIGNYLNDPSRYVANLHPEADLYVLDDGTLSMVIAENVSKPFVMHGGRVSQLIKKALFGKKILGTRPFSFFSKYELNAPANYSVVVNTNQWMKTQIAQKEVDKRVIFLSQPLIEIELISKGDYLKYLQEVQQKEGGEIQLIRHPREKVLSDKEINQAGYQVVEVDNCIELELLHGETLPSLICGYYSSAFYELRSMFGEKLNLKLYFPDNENLKGRYKEEVEGVVDVMKSEFKHEYI